MNASVHPEGILPGPEFIEDVAIFHTETTKVEHTTTNGQATSNTTESKTIDETERWHTENIYPNSEEWNNVGTTLAKSTESYSQDHSWGWSIPFGAKEYFSYGSGPTEISSSSSPQAGASEGSADTRGDVEGERLKEGLAIARSLLDALSEIDRLKYESEQAQNAIDKGTFGNGRNRRSLFDNEISALNNIIRDNEFRTKALSHDVGLFANQLLDYNDVEVPGYWSYSEYQTGGGTGIDALLEEAGRTGGGPAGLGPGNLWTGGAEILSGTKLGKGLLKFAAARRVPGAPKAASKLRPGSVSGNPANRLIETGVPTKNGGWRRQWTRITRADELAHRESISNHYDQLHDVATTRGLTDSARTDFLFKGMQEFRSKLCADFLKNRTY